MRISICLLAFAVFITACKPIVRTSDAYQEEKEEERKRMSWKKGALIVAGAGITLFGGFKMAKYLNRILGEKMLQANEVMALLERSLSLRTKKFRIEKENFPLYKMIAPDGSEHHLLGTFHTTGIGIDDLPANSRTLKIFDESTDFILEYEADSFWNVSKTSAKGMRQQMQDMNANFDLRKALGDEYMDKLSAQLQKNLDVNDGDSDLKDYYSAIEQMLPTHALAHLDSLAHQDALGQVGAEMDVQLLRRAREAKKKVSGLEKPGKAANAMFEAGSKARPDDTYAINTLKKFIDAGGIENRIKEWDKVRLEYIDGNIESANELVNRYGFDDNTKKIMLDDRNQDWIKRGRIQKNCQQGKKCMIAVGISHLVEGDNTLIKLLQQEGYRIEKVE